jgi:hypothetical protein
MVGKEKHSNTDLALTGEIGERLVKLALESITKRLQDQCIGEIETVLNLIELTKQRIIVEEGRLKIYAKRLEAIRAGKVEIVKNPAGNVLIVYKDEKLHPEKVGF